MLKGKKHIHFIGIGGIGMSGLALILSDMGIKVSGSDIKPNHLTQKLIERGVKIYSGHKALNVENDVDLIVYSSAIIPKNPEYALAQEKGIPIVQRAKILAELMDTKKGIAITGAHGKTTTTSLISLILKRAGLDPTIIIGGVVDFIDGNACLGKGEYLVAEADESDGSFLNLHPFYEVITNIDREHLDYYHSLEEVITAHHEFINNLKSGGCVFCGADDENIKTLLKDIVKEVVTYGLSTSRDFYPDNIAMTENIAEFNCLFRGEKLGKVNLNIPGLHNIVNALAAVALSHKIKIPFNQVAAALSEYKGAGRRFQIKNSGNDIMIIDDYAHHPTEIKATLEAARGWKNRRIISVFQPHRYTRTKYLKEEFGKCFSLTDHLVITDIYAASEEPIDGVSSRDIYEKVLESGHKNVYYLPKDKIISHLLKVIKPTDMVLILGAGDIEELVDELAQRLKK